MPSEDRPNDLQIGAMLGEIRAEIRLQREEHSKIEPQLIQILDSQNRADGEIEKLARDVVEVRQGMKAVADETKSMHARIERLEGGHRAPSHSVTSEVRSELAAQHDSLRAVASNTEDVRTETYRQTALINEQAPSIERASKNSNYAAAVAGLGAVATLLTTLIQSCHH